VLERTPDLPCPDLAADPGIDIYRMLISSIRTGSIADTLTLSFRLITLHAGERAFLDILKGFWRDFPPEPYPLKEAENFRRYVAGLESGIPHLDEVLSYELASYDAILSKEARSVPFSCNPLLLLEALKAGKLPEAAMEGAYELRVTP
jgi:hypothetical protein